MKIDYKEGENFVLIERKDNGWVITYPTNGAAWEITNSEVYPDDEDSHLSHLKSLQTLFWSIKEALGEYTKKYEENLVFLIREKDGKIMEDDQ